MKILILGVDGFTGFPLTQYLLLKGYSVLGVDCFHRRQMVKEVGSQSVIPIAKPEDRWKALKDLGEFDFKEFDIVKEYEKLRNLILEFEPDTIINLAQQPSAAYSQKSIETACFTYSNNNLGHLNLLWAVRHTGNKHIPIIHIGTMGEYGQGINGPIPEGFFKATWRGYQDILPFPRQAGSLYHNSKVQMSDTSWFACRIFELRDTDIHQGIIFGTRAPHKMKGVYRTRLDQDECFGTCINRFVCCASKEIPLPVYGSGEQVRAMLSLRDSIRAITLLVENSPTDEDSFHSYRCVNQFTKFCSVNEIAKSVKEIGEKDFGLNIEIKHIENPRVEEEIHFYQPIAEKLKNLGFKSTVTLEDEIKLAFEDVLPHRDRILEDKIYPKIKWRKEIEQKT